MLKQINYKYSADTVIPMGRIVPALYFAMKRGRVLGRKRLINHTAIPWHENEKIARRILPDILAYYDGAEDQRAFDEWKAQREQVQTQDNDT